MLYNWGVTNFSGAKNRRLAEWDKLCFRLDNHFLQEPIMEETKLPEIKVEKSVKQLLNLCQKGNSPSIFYWERLADRFRPCVMCKVLTYRLKGAGMRWDRYGADAIMALISFQQLNTWTSYRELRSRAVQPCQKIRPHPPIKLLTIKVLI
jgi:hypothetical protein